MSALLHASDWPHWRGPHRNDTTDESSGWTGKGPWLADGELWRVKVGPGATSPIVAGEHVYTMGWNGESDDVHCLDAKTGRTVWSRSYPSRAHSRYAEGDTQFYEGPTSTPEYDADSGFLFTLGIDGDLHAWDTRSEGAKAWGFNLYDKYHMPPRPRVGRSTRRDYGYTSSPFAQGEWILVEVGGPAGTLLAFDKRSGERRWASDAKDFAGHTGGLAPMTVDGIPCVVVLTLSRLLVVRVDEAHPGATVASYDWATDYANNIPSPAVDGSTVFVTSGYNQSATTKLAISGSGARKLWSRPVFSKTCTPVVSGGFVYWAWDRIRCLDSETGDEVWEGPCSGHAGSVIVTADRRLIVLAGGRFDPRGHSSGIR